MCRRGMRPRAGCPLGAWESPRTGLRADPVDRSPLYHGVQPVADFPDAGPGRADAKPGPEGAVSDGPPGL
jgi:hypothetical protein